MKRIKRTWVCKKCNDCDCTVSRNSEAEKPDVFDPPGLVKKGLCLIAPTMFTDAEWKEAK